MKDITILRKAMDKAIKNGWDIFGLKKAIHSTQIFKQSYFRGNLAIRFYCAIGCVEVNIEKIIFDHDFLKAFFKGESFVTPRGCACHPSNAWQYYGQIMLLEEEPLKYLEKFLFLKVKHIKTKRMDEPTKEELKALRKKYFKKYAKGYKIDKSIASKIINKLKGWYGIK